MAGGLSSNWFQIDAAPQHPLHRGRFVGVGALAAVAHELHARDVDATCAQGGANGVDAGGGEAQVGGRIVFAELAGDDPEALRGRGSNQRRRGIDVSRMDLVSDGSKRPDPDKPSAVQRMLWSRIDLEPVGR